MWEKEKTSIAAGFQGVSYEKIIKGNIMEKNQCSLNNNNHYFNYKRA